MATIITSLCLDEPGTGTVYPQVGTDSADPRFQAIYWRCVVVFFGSVYRLHGPHTTNILMTNRPPPRVAAGVPVCEALERFGVRVVEQSFDSRPPKGFTREWGNTFYLIDVLTRLSDSDLPDPLMVFDCDVVVTKSLDVWAEAATEKFSSYRLTDIDRGATIHGLTDQQLRSIFERHGISEPVLCGGEFIGARKDVLRQVSKISRDLWVESIRAYNQGEPYMRAEEEILSLAYQILDLPIGNANAFIRRIWTGFKPKNNNARPSDMALTAWHLPAEKRTGLRRLSEAMLDARSWVWTSDRFTRQAANIVGIPRRSASKFFLDIKTRARSL